VKSYPTIVIYPPNDKARHEEYGGTRTASYIVASALEKKKDYATDYSVPRLDSTDTFTSLCDKKKTLCVIAVVNDESEVNLLKPLVKKFAARRLKFLYVLAGT
jgi:hypothetical protein